MTAEIRIDGAPRPLKLTLGALAEIEAGLGGGDLASLIERLKRPSAADILLVLRALLKGGGADFTVAALGALDIDLADAARAIAAAFAGLGDPDAAPDDVPGDREAPGKLGPGKLRPGKLGAGRETGDQMRSPGATGSEPACS